MIGPYSRLKVADNSGASELMVISAIGGAKRNAASLGDLVTATVKKAQPRGMVKKKEVVKAVIVRIKAPYGRADGTTIRFDDNAAILLNPDLSPKGSRVFGPVARELRERGFQRLISLAPEVL